MRGELLVRIGFDVLILAVLHLAFERRKHSFVILNFVPQELAVEPACPSDPPAVPPPCRGAH